MTSASVVNNIIKNLGFLVEQDTQNPPRNIKATDALFVHLSDYFGNLGFEVDLKDLGGGHVIFYAKRGDPDVLFNAHLDTVPIDPSTLSGWKKAPLKVTIEDGKAFGRGSCDIKGAAACLMTLAEVADNLAVVFTTDEEGKKACCVQSFIDNNDLNQYKQVVVAEPTKSQAILSHRGYLSAQVNFNGSSGHSSLPIALKNNAIHKSVKWLSEALSYSETFVTEKNPAGLCFNIGIVKGGEKSNMIAESAFVHFSARVPADQSSSAILKNFKQLDESNDSLWDVVLFPTLPAEHENSKLNKDLAVQFCQDHQLNIGEPVDFWTEASLFSHAGLPTIVLGPGDIKQAHTVDEWVELAQLEQCYQIYADMVKVGDCHEKK